jgi:hypothetical protein
MTGKISAAETDCEFRERPPKENPAADGQGHGGVPGPFERGSTVGAASATLAGDPVFRNVAVLKNQRAILFKYAASALSSASKSFSAALPQGGLCRYSRQ